MGHAMRKHFWAPADSEGRDQPVHPCSLIRAYTVYTANRNIGYYRMYEWRAKSWMILAHMQDDLNLCILRLFEALFRLTWSISFIIVINAELYL